MTANIETRGGQWSDRSSAYPGVAGQSAVMLLSRIFLCALFIIGGFGKIFATAGFAAMMAGHGVPLAPYTPYAAIVIELVGGLVLLFGFQTRLLAVLFAIYTVVVSIIGHNFWDMTDAARMGNQIHFFKNISIVGGFLALYVTGGGRYSIDSLLRR